jgi:hypothetical protein
MQSEDFISPQCSLDRESAVILRHAAQPARVYSKTDIAPRPRFTLRLAGLSAEDTL